MELKENGFYKLSEKYVKLIEDLNGIYKDNKTRPIYCCIQDNRNPNIYWAIPTSDISHRPQSQIDRITHFCNLPNNDLRSCYYHIAHTDRPAIFKISNALPISSDYISAEYTSKGKHLILNDKKVIFDIEKKLKKILAAENRRPNLFEQKITSIYNYLSQEILLKQKSKDLFFIKYPQNHPVIKEIKTQYPDCLSVSVDNSIILAIDKKHEENIRQIEKNIMKKNPRKL